MPVREFSDENGRLWRAWDIRPEAIHPVTKAEDYLADCYVTGWIVFETADETEKRRLCPWPIRWMDEPEEGLRALLAAAEVVRRDRHPTERDVTDTVVRSFRYPGGRLWSVCVIMNPEIGVPAALRFSSGMRYLDVKKWPKDWADLPDDDLVKLLRRSTPRPPSTPPAGTPLRRWDDAPGSRA